MRAFLFRPRIHLLAAERGIAREDFFSRPPSPRRRSGTTRLVRAVLSARRIRSAPAGADAFGRSASGIFAAVDQTAEWWFDDAMPC